MRHLQIKSRPKSLNTLRKRAKKAALLLQKEYGSPRHGNKKNPLDELIFIILSLMTTHHSFNRVYNRLKKRIGNWECLLATRLNSLRSIIKDGGLSDQKARNIMRIVKRLKQDFGKVTLAPIKRMSDFEAEAYLTSLPGVGVKTAKCILMYSLNRKVLPVDTHVWRVARRLELVNSNITYSFIHKELEKVVLPKDRYSFHVNALSHGRKVCIAIKPKCTTCCLRAFCPFSKRAK